MKDNHISFQSCNSFSTLSVFFPFEQENMKCLLKMASLLAILATPVAVVLGLIALKPSDFIRYGKWILSYIYIKYYRRTRKKRFDLYDMEAHHDPVKVAFLPPQLEYDLESPQSEAHLLHGADEVFLYGVNSHSERLIVRIARSLNNEGEAWIYLKLKDGNVYRLKETSGYEHACSDSEREFTCGGLKVHYLKPMRSWRIFYHGLLRQTSERDPSIDKMVYVKFALLWRASSDCFDMTTDINIMALASAFSRSKWESLMPPVEKLNSAFNCYAQSGVIMGTVHVDGETEETTIYLFGEKMRFLGETNLEKAGEFIHIMGQISKTGSIMHVAEATLPGVVDKLRFGFVVMPSGLLAPISDFDFLIEHKVEEKDESVKSIFHADGMTFKVAGHVTGKQAHFESKKGWDGSLSIEELSIQMNSLKGSGVLIKAKLFGSQKRMQVSSPTKEVLSGIPTVVHFKERLCQLSEVTGGKGSSLGKLTHLSQTLQNFTVPNGIVVTTSAYEAFVNKDILKQIKYLEGVLYGNVSGDVKEACQRVIDTVIKANMPNHVMEDILKCLQKHFGKELHSKKFAVRSSATGEDTEQMSAAGQMETFLGVKSMNEIITAVKKCWASQFGFIAVQYKRQNGQIVNSPMAVVIQEMVPCDTAGVLFTCDPLTGNPTLMSITANYGLGESVVSGSEEPDTITLVRDSEDNLTIKEKIIGAKSHRIVVKDDEGTSVEDVSDNEKNSCCLSDDMALFLGNIAVQIEKSYRSNRDIEWGFWNNKLYIFQSRPVTSGTGETDFEIDHEMDAPMRTEREDITVSNVGEVMPGAMTPLGLDVLMKFFSIPLQRRSEVEWQSRVLPRYFPKGITYFSYHIMFYTADLMQTVGEGKSVIEAFMVGLFGRFIEDEELFEAALIRYGRYKESFLKKYRKLIKSLFAAGKRLIKAQKQYAKYDLSVDNMKDPQKVFDLLMYTCDDFNEAFLAHATASQGSSMWNMLMLSILGKARGGINADAYRDFARLLACISGVESADVPAAMQSLAYHIGKEIDAKDFKKLDPEEALKWLKSSPSTAGIKFREFLDKHSHRCLKEFDIRSTTWGMNPKLLVQLLQNFVGNVNEDKSVKVSEDFSQILSELDAHLGFVSRMMLRFLLPQCRSAVQTRESTKSLLIKLLHMWRIAYRHLAKLMVSEGRIPDEDLMYFMTLEELKELLSNRSPKIISKANHRRRRYPILDSYIFPEMMKGFPTPINLDNTPVTPSADNFMMKGIPVSQGVAKGFVRVALTLEEASNLKPGEILLTYSTDIGWTPYFPTLAGVVTELGGLISHGAVVSREYGLPCIAGLHGATRQFQTGDYVLLEGNKGILQKLSPPES